MEVSTLIAQLRLESDLVDSIETQHLFLTLNYLPTCGQEQTIDYVIVHTLDPFALKSISPNCCIIKSVWTVNTQDVSAL